MFWEEVFGIVKESGYEGCITLESFANDSLESS